MLIRKQISNPFEKYKTMGVVGVLSLVRKLAGAEADLGASHQFLADDGIERKTKACL
jgi:hypothetical protein